MSQSGIPSDPRTALSILRLIWGVLIGGQVLIAGVFTVINATGPVMQDAQFGGYIAGFAGLILLTGAPIGLFLRGQTFKRHWSGDAVTPDGYGKGCLLAWGPIEGASTVGLIAMFVGGSLWPFGLPTAISIGLLIALRPNGRAMQPTANPDAFRHDISPEKQSS